MAIDYGDKRIGIAMSDPMRIIASPYEVFESVSREKNILHIEKLIKENEVKVVVLGLPLNIDGSEGERATKTRKFGEELKKKSKIEVVYQDERLSSYEAEELMLSAGLKRDKRKKNIDKLAAAIILQQYIDRNE